MFSLLYMVQLSPFLAVRYIHTHTCSADRVQGLFLRTPPPPTLCDVLNSHPLCSCEVSLSRITSLQNEAVGGVFRFTPCDTAEQFNSPLLVPLEPGSAREGGEKERKAGRNRKRSEGGATPRHRGWKRQGWMLKEGILSGHSWEDRRKLERGSENPPPSRVYTCAALDSAWGIVGLKSSRTLRVGVSWQPRLPPPSQAPVLESYFRACYLQCWDTVQEKSAFLVPSMFPFFSLPFFLSVFPPLSLLHTHSLTRCGFLTIFRPCCSWATMSTQ